MSFSQRMINNKYFKAVAHSYFQKFKPRWQALAEAASTANLYRNCKAVGEGSFLKGAGYISDYRSMVIGRNVHIGENFYFKSEGGLSIGDNAHISRNVTIYTVNHRTDGRRVPYDDSFERRPVRIGKNVWIGMNVSIAPGTVIGEGAIIGLGSTISGEIAPHSIVVSEKHRIVGHRDVAHYDECVYGQRFGGRDGAPVRDDLKTLNGREAGEGLFFVVSTGRSGSATLAEVLNRHDMCRCEHEPRHNMIRLSTQALHGELSPIEVEQEIVSNFIDCSIYPNNLVCGESDHKYGNLIPQLADAMPQAKFIWVIRGAESVVASSVGRGWFDDFEYGYAEKPVRPEFSERKWSEYRGNGYLAGVFSEQEWRQMSAFERNCWYWRFWNEKIEQDLNAHAPGRWKLVRLEELNDSIQGVQTFLGLSGPSLTVTVENKARHDKVTRNTWTQSDQDAFDRWCAEGMERWYGGVSR